MGLWEEPTCGRVGTPRFAERVRRSIPYPRKGHVETQEAVGSLGAHRRAPQRLRRTRTPALLGNMCTGFFCERPGLYRSPVFP